MSKFYKCYKLVSVCKSTYFNSHFYQAGGLKYRYECVILMSILWQIFDFVKLFFKCMKFRRFRKAVEKSKYYSRG